MLVGADTDLFEESIDTVLVLFEVFEFCAKGLKVCCYHLNLLFLTFVIL